MGIPHGFLWDEEGWRLAPAYDIVPQPVFELDQPGRLALGVGPEGPLATYGNALAGCHHFGLTQDAANEIIERVRGRIRQWEDAFRAEEVPAKDFSELRSVFRLAAEHQSFQRPAPNTHEGSMSPPLAYSQAPSFIF